MTKSTAGSDSPRAGTEVAVRGAGAAAQSHTALEPSNRIKTNYRQATLRGLIAAYKQTNGTTSFE